MFCTCREQLVPKEGVAKRNPDLSMPDTLQMATTHHHHTEQFTHYLTQIREDWEQKQKAKKKKEMQIRDRKQTQLE